ncbi:Suppressor of Profilin del [Microsporum canis]
MELSRQEYPALAGILQPGQTISVVTERLRTVNKLNTDVADWLAERRRLEEVYYVGLRKLARRPHPEGGQALGVFEVPWQRILSATESMAQSHEALATGIETDAEKPLREYETKNADMKSMVSIQNDLSSLVKTLETAQKKLDKIKDKGPKHASKVPGAQSAVDDAKTQWQSRAPFVLEQLQAIDEHRVNHLRDILTQYQTHESDQVERSRQAAESSLNSLLNIQAGEEIRAYVSKKSGGRLPAEIAPSTPATPSARQETPTSPKPTPPAMAEPLPSPPPVHDDSASQRSGMSAQRRPSLQQAPEPRHTAFGGLKRLGTVMGRRKSMIVPSPGPSEKKFRSPFTPFRRADPSRNFQQMDESDGPNGLETVTSSESQRPSSSALHDSAIVESPPPTASNGIPEEAAAKEPAVTNGEPTGAPTQTPQVDAEGYSQRPDTEDEITRIQREAAATDDSGINLTIRDQPIPEDESEAKEALNQVANTLRLKAQQSGVARGPGTVRGRRDVRNTIFVPPPSGAGHNTESSVPAFNLATPANTASPEMPRSSVSLEKAVHEDHTVPDNTSIHSSQTLHSLSGPITHPELPEPGLNVSIVEKLTAMVADGVVTRSFVVGELALAYNNNSSGNEAPDTGLIRLNNFGVLERVAANPQFVTENAPVQANEDEPASDDSQKGIYQVRLAPIAGPTPTVAFKYQVHLDPLNLSSYCPVIFTPVWNEEEFQASVIVQYSLNPQFISPDSGASVVLHNLLLSVNLDISQIDETTMRPREAARAVGAAMHPSTGAVFRRKNSSVTWKIPELEVGPGQDGKFLARFTTSTSWPRRGKVEAKFDATCSDNASRLGVSVSTPQLTAAQAGNKDKVDDPFADDDLNTANEQSPSAETWTEPLIERKLTVAKYVST